MANSKHVLVCCDFDGTMTLQDTGVLLIDRCMGQEKRKELDHKVLQGQLALRDTFSQMWGSVDLTFDEALEILKDVKLDSKFATFAEFCFAQEIPVVVVSAGLDFVIEMFLKRFFPQDYKKFRIVSNLGKLEDRKWSISFQDESPFGHDKGQTMKKLQAEYAATHDGFKPYTFFCGDGVSDLSAATHADVLFVRQNSDLERYCLEHKISYKPFDTFQVVLDEVQHYLNSN